MSFWDNWDLDKAKQVARGVVELVAPEFVATDEERDKNRQRILEEGAREIERRRHGLNGGGGELAGEVAEATPAPARPARKVAAQLPPPPAVVVVDVEEEG